MCCIASDADAPFGIRGCSLVLIGRVCLGTWLVEQNLREGKRGLDEGLVRLTSTIFLVIGLSKEPWSFSSKISLVNTWTRLDCGSFSTPDMRHCTMVLFSIALCKKKVPSPTQPYSLSTLKYSSPNAATAWSNGITFLQSQNPVDVAVHSSFSTTYWRTVPNMPSAPIRPSKLTV